MGATRSFEIFNDGGLMKIVKYKNRKLYNVETKKYVNLEKIAQAIALGTPVTVTDHKTKQDITHSIFARIVYNMELENKTSLNTLKLMIKSRSLTAWNGEGA